MDILGDSDTHDNTVFSEFYRDDPGVQSADDYHGGQYGPEAYAASYEEARKGTGGTNAGNGGKARSFRPGVDDIEIDLDAKDADKAGAKAGASTLEASRVDWTSLIGRTPPPRQFVWKDWIPRGEVTLLHGFGGVGKSLLCQQIGTAVTQGLFLFGMPTISGPVLILTGEDDCDEVWRRQMDICNRFGISIDDVAKNLIVYPVPHLDITIAETSAGGGIQQTPMFKTLQDAISKTHPCLTILDNVAKLFATDENSRVVVTRAVGLLKSLCHDFGTTVLIVSHNNKNGAYSGCTAWENACRSRMSLARDDDDALTLSRPKANYAANGETRIQWNAGSFINLDDECMTESERMGAAIEIRRHADVFLAALDTLRDRNINVSHKQRAGNYAPKAIVDAKLSDGLTRAQLAKAMALLFDEGRIIANVEIGSSAHRNKLVGLARADK